jgi:hypothetical protein
VTACLAVVGEEEVLQPRRPGDHQQPPDPGADVLEGVRCPDWAEGQAARLLLRRAVQGAAGTDAAAADLEATIDDARLESFSVHARRAAATGQLAVPEDECRDVLFATTDGSLWITLVARRGWSDARYAEWLGGLWVGLLVANSGDPSGRASR